MGVTIAFEIVRQLEQMNEEIHFFAMFDVVAPTNRLNRCIKEFSIASELNWIKNYLPDNKIKEKVKNIKALELLWSEIINHLETTNFDGNNIKKLFPKNISVAIPNFEKLGTKELINYLNISRSFSNARELYIPKEKVKTPIHHFVASKSKNIIDHQQWNNYTDSQIITYEVKGDHYSIFKKPEVVEFATVFDKVLEELTGKKKVWIRTLWFEIF